MRPSFFVGNQCRELGRSDLAQVSSRFVVLERSEAAFLCEQKRAVQDDENGEGKMSLCWRRDLSVWDSGVVEAKAGGRIGAEVVGVVEAEAGSVSEVEAVESSKAVGNGEARAVSEDRKRSGETQERNQENERRCSRLAVINRSHKSTQEKERGKSGASVACL